MGLCPGEIAGITVASVLALPLLAALGLVPLHLLEKHERRKLARLNAKAEARSDARTEQKTVVVENKGPIAGQAGVAEVVTTGPAGTAVQTVPTDAFGSAVVSTGAAGIPGATTTVAQGQTKVVTAEHPAGKPEQAEVTREHVVSH